MRFTERLGPAAGLALLASLACDGADLVVPEGEPASVLVVAGDRQEGVVGDTLADSIVVRVTDPRGDPVPGRVVVFEGKGEGEVLSPDTVVTDSAGRAATLWTLGTRAGSQRVRAFLPPDEGRPPVSVGIVAEAAPAAPAMLRRLAGDKQVARPGTFLPDSLVVLATDRFGNPVGGVAVRWSASGSGAVSDSLTAADPSGRTGVRWALGTESGEQTASAELLGAGTPVAFTAVATTSPGP